MSVVVWEVLGMGLQEFVSVNVCGCVRRSGCEPREADVDRLMVIALDKNQLISCVCCVGILFYPGLVSLLRCTWDYTH